MQINVNIQFGADEEIPDITVEELAAEVLAAAQGDPEKDVCVVSVMRPPVTGIVGNYSAPTPTPSPE